MKICLCMIVRNESATIARALQSVKHLIDEWCIVDTGSTDDTVDKILAVMCGVPGTLHHRAWINFGHNRSEVLQLAKDKADYLLILDGDQEMVSNGITDHFKAGLTAGAYIVTVKHGDLEYGRTVLVKADLGWHYHGSTHEYITCPAGGAPIPYHGFHLIEHGKPGAREDKFYRDIVLLGMDLKKNPLDPRTTFYLAQTYRDLWRITKAEHFREHARTWYKQRIGLGGWDEELFYARYQYALLTSGAEMLHLLMVAWESRPKRLEPLHDIVRFCRNNSLHHTAFRLAWEELEIAELGFVSDDILFVSQWIWDWGLAFEVSICAYHVGRYKICIQLSDSVIRCSTAPDNVREQASKNRGLAQEKLCAH